MYVKVTLHRNDLDEHKRAKPIREIDIYSFKIFCREFIDKSHFVEFEDNDGKKLILKDREA